MFETETGGGANRVGPAPSITSKNKAWCKYVHFFLGTFDPGKRLQPSEVVANPVELG